MKNITNPDQGSLLLEDLIIWTNYEIEVAAYNGAGRGTYSHKVTEWTLQGGEGQHTGIYITYCFTPTTASRAARFDLRLVCQHHIVLFRVSVLASVPSDPNTRDNS